MSTYLDVSLKRLLDDRSRDLASARAVFALAPRPVKTSWNSGKPKKPSAVGPVAQRFFVSAGTSSAIDPGRVFNHLFWVCCVTPGRDRLPVASGGNFGGK